MEAMGKDKLEFPADTHRAGSGFEGQTAQEVFDGYARWFRRLRVVNTLLALAIGAGAIACALWDVWLGYLAFFLLLIVEWFIQNARVTLRFQGVQKILTEDCDVYKYRSVMELFAQRWHRKSTQSVVHLELAACEHELDNPRGVLEHLSHVQLRRRSIRWIRAYNLQAFALNDLGDVSARDAALGQLAGRAASLRNKRLKEETLAVLRAMRLRFEPHEQWGADDAAFMRDQLAVAVAHSSRVSWSLMLAEYELMAGRSQIAQGLLSDEMLTPLTPRAARLRDELRRRLGVTA